LALSDLGGWDDEIEAWAGDRGWKGRELPAALRTADEYEVAQSARLPGISLASHSWTHPNLTRLDDESLRDELARPLEWMTSRFEHSPRWIAYPYGLADDRVAAAAKAVGYEAGFRVDGGWLPRREDEIDRFMLPRLNVPAGLSDPGFRCRLAGLL